jgi:peptidoglycan/LPS O-acetylase OafA/YrhL
MLGVVRFGLEVVLFFFLLGAVVGVADGQTDTGWRIVLVVIAVVCVVAAPFVRRIGREDGVRRHGGTAAG